MDIGGLSWGQRGCGGCYEGVGDRVVEGAWDQKDILPTTG